MLDEILKSVGDEVSVCSRKYSLSASGVLSVKSALGGRVLELIGANREIYRLGDQCARNRASKRAETSHPFQAARRTIIGQEIWPIRTSNVVGVVGGSKKSSISKVVWHYIAA